MFGSQNEYSDHARAMQLIEGIKNKIQNNNDYNDDVKILEQIKETAEDYAREPGNGIDCVKAELWELAQPTLKAIKNFLGNEMGGEMHALIQAKLIENMDACTNKMDALTAKVDALTSKMDLIHDLLTLLTNPPELLAEKNVSRPASSTFSR